MDTVAYSHYDMKFTIACMEKVGNAYQDFFSDIMERYYPGDFQQAFKSY